MNQIFRFCKFDPLLISRHYGNQGKTPTHYQILRVPETASPKDIKEAFIKLSKEMHPDIKGNQFHNEFVKITEAYNVLSKEILKRDYDMNLKYGHSRNISSHYGHPYANRKHSNGFEYYHQPPNFRNREEYEQYRDSQAEDNYHKAYRTKQVNKFFFVFILVVFATFSAFMQVFLVNKRLIENRDFYTERTLRYNKEFNEAKEKAKSKTIEHQVQDFRAKVESAKSDK